MIKHYMSLLISTLAFLVIFFTWLTMHLDKKFIINVGQGLKYAFNFKLFVRNFLKLVVSHVTKKIDMFGIRNKII